MGKQASPKTFISLLYNTNGHSKTIGTKIRLFGAETSIACPASLQDAQSNTTSFTPVLASSDATSSAQDGSNNTGNLTTTFYITNGLHKLGTPFTDTTSIRVAEPAGTGGGCWDTSDGSTVKVGACNLNKNQTFYVRPEINYINPES